MIEFPVVIDGAAVPIAISESMGVRLTRDSAGICWIALSDNSVWRSPANYEETLREFSRALPNRELTYPFKVF